MMNHTPVEYALSAADQDARRNLAWSLSAVVL